MSTLEALVEWEAVVWQGKTPTHIIPKMAFGSAIYHIWKERNARSFRLEAKLKEKVLHDICHQIYLQIHIKWRTDPQLPHYLAKWGS